jgi:hypothetical protein
MLPNFRHYGSKQLTGRMVGEIRWNEKASLEVTGHLPAISLLRPKTAFMSS